MNVNPDRHLHVQGDRSTVPASRVSSDTGVGSAKTGPSPQAATDLSARAQEFLRLRPRLSDLAGPSREDRIATLRDRIASGTYQVDGEQVAGAMLRDPAAARLLGVTPTR